jgi:hypothetical protein
MDIRLRYEYEQLDLACLDTHGSDFSDYGQCLQRSHQGSSVDTINLMFEANGACTFDDRDPETYDERHARWDAERSQRMAAEQVAA